MSRLALVWLHKGYAFDPGDWVLWVRMTTKNKGKSDDNSNGNGNSKYGDSELRSE